MKKFSIDPKLFWEQKILEWEEGRYFLQRDKKNSLLELIADYFSSSVRFRLKVAMDILRPHVIGKKAVELGCGSGLLAKPIIDANAESYLGIDIAERAINLARKRNQRELISNKVSFRVGSITSQFLPPADIYFSLGLIDWLTDEQLDLLFRYTMKADFLHTFSEKRFSLSQWLHRVYIQVTYAKKTGGYVPQYFSVDELQQLSSKYILNPFFVIRNPKLSFGAIITSLPQKEDPNDNSYSVCG